MQKGFTLIILMISVVILTVVALGSFSIFRPNFYSSPGVTAEGQNNKTPIEKAEDAKGLIEQKDNLQYYYLYNQGVLSPTPTI